MSDLWPLRALPEAPAELPIRLAEFDCGKATLNVFLHTNATFNQQTGVCRTTYLHPPSDPDTVAGYYSLALAVVDQEEIPSRVRRRLIARARYGSCLRRDDVETIARQVRRKSKGQ
jgi:hypothetical protein